jgi:hypothetical protein
VSLQGSAQSPVTATAPSLDNDDDEEARFQADLARAIEASKQDLSPVTSIASLSSDLSQINDIDAAPHSTASAQSNPSFLRERAQLERERLARLKRLCDELHPQDTEPPSKRPTLSRVMSSAPASKDGSTQRGRQDVEENVEVFWDGELRQTANAHVELSRNGEDGRQVFRLSQIIGDVSRFFYSTCVRCPLRKEPDPEITDRTGHHLDVRPPATLDIYLFPSQHSCRTCNSTCAVREWESDHKRGPSKLDSRYTLFTWWTWRDAHEGASSRALLVGVHLMVSVFLIVLSDGKVTCRCLDRQPHGSRLA